MSTHASPATARRPTRFPATPRKTTRPSFRTPPSPRTCQNACGPSHGDKFDSLDKIKGQRDMMLGLTSSGALPRQNPTRKDTPEAKAVTVFLSKSPELD